MKKAAIVLATLVAFLLSGGVYAGTKTISNMPSTAAIFGAGGSLATDAGVLKVAGAPLVGEYIPATTTALSIVPETSVAVSGIGTLAKSLIKGGLVGVAVGVATDELLKGLDWVMTDGVVSKKEALTGDYIPAGTDYYWTTGVTYNGTLNYSTPSAACQAEADYANQVSARDPSSPNYFVPHMSMSDTSHYSCAIYSASGSYYYGADATRYGSACPANSSLDASTGVCNFSGSTSLTESDYNQIAPYIASQPATFQRDLTNELCNGSETCYKLLDPSTVLTGPATVTGTPTTVTTTGSNGVSTTTTTTPTTSLTYGSNYYNYTTNNTVTTTNNNTGETTTTTSTQDVSTPAVPDLLSDANAPLLDLKDQIANQKSTAGPLPYQPWFSFAQSCTEFTITLPYYGPLTTDNCKYIRQYVWPVLYFLFASFTVIHCWQAWRETVTRVRSS